MKAITINERAIKQWNLKSINQVKKWLDQLGIETLVISAERGTVNQNVHYHLLVEDFNEDKERELWTMAIWNDTVTNELAYYEYIIKDGNVKLFNNYEPPIKSTSNNEYESLLNDIFENNLSLEQLRIKYPKLYVRYHKTIRDIVAYAKN